VPHYSDPQCKPKSADSLPASFDWRQKNIVTPIKNQGDCGSCWAHATAASIESAWAIKTGRIIDLSEQYLIDCTVPDGCDGSYIDDAYSFIVNHRIPHESAYPYKAYVNYLVKYILINIETIIRL